MLQVIFVFSDLILTEQIIASSTLSLLEESDFQKKLPGILSGRLGHD